MIHLQSETTNTVLTGVKEGDFQPNAVDLRLDKVFIIHKNIFVIDNDTKQHRGSTEVIPDQDGWYALAPGSYEVIMENKIVVPEGEAGWVITRSTLNRNDVFITSGLYDSGYGKSGAAVMAGVLHVGTENMKIKQGTRIGQYICVKSETQHLYDGDYGKVGGHDDKYIK